MDTIKSKENPSKAKKGIAPRSVGGGKGGLTRVRSKIGRGRQDAATADAFRVKAKHVIQRIGGPTATARLIGVATSQPSRWVRGQEAPSARSRKHVLDLDYVLSRLEELYEPSVAARWLESPNSFLDGASPLDVLLLEGPAPVIEAVDATIAGSYA